MSAARHLHPGQLSMFMPAGKMVDALKGGSIGSADLPYYDDFDAMQARKVDEARHNTMGWEGRRLPAGHPNTLLSSMRREGIREPVEFKYVSNSPTPFLIEGHHRVFAANEISPKTEVPIEHT
jgi:hypothetical protein